MNPSKIISKIEEIIDLCTDNSLIAALQKTLTLSYAIDDEELERWVGLELSGYTKTNPYFEHSEKFPYYRKIIGIYTDANNRPLSEYIPDLKEFNFFYLKQGVLELLAFSQRNKTIVIPHPLTEDVKDDMKLQMIEKFHFEPAIVLGVLQIITNQLLRKLSLIRKQLLMTSQDAFSLKEALTMVNGMHPVVKTVAINYLEQNNYRSAILDTYIEMVNMVKNKSGLSNDDGSTLMDKAFSVNKPVLKYTDDKNKQQGIMLLFKGAVMAIRNPNAHKIIRWENLSRTLEWLSFASGLLHILDECEVVSYPADA
ncbi:TIGR02391 family protein [Runella zeae]|uniref:TIGR02391 family protein n=1 Tax=Runella zeae TaxID=94255 RepID=UPI0003FE461B|nr:TIGR02391 family protein [Runella zeae]